MACSTVSNGRSIPCKSAVGGLKNIFFAPYTDTTAALTDSAGTITLDDSVSFYKYELLKGTSTLETAITSSRENGTTYYETTLNVSLVHLDVATQEQIKLLAHGRPQIVVETYQGDGFLVGKDHGAEVTGGTIVTGAAFADFNGFTLTLTAQETAPPFFVATLPSDDSTSPIDPNA